MNKISLIRRAEIGRERRDRSRGRILAAAARTIAENDAATVDDVIRAAGVARGTFYNHFKTRDDMLAALWTSIGHDPFSDIQRRARPIADPVERFAMVTRLVLLGAAANPTWGWLVVALSGNEATLNDDLRGYPGPDLRAGRAAGKFAYEDEAAASDLVVNAVRGAMRAMLTDGRDARYAQSVCAMLLLALGTDRAEASRMSSLPLPQFETRND